MASTPYISIDIYVYTCIEARLSTGSYFPVRQRVVVLVWSSRPVQLLMYSPTRITSSSLAHFSHFKCPLSFIFSLSFPPLLPYSLPPSLPPPRSSSLARTRSHTHHIYRTFYLSDTILSFSSTVSLLSSARTHATSPTRSLSLYTFYIYIYVCIGLSPSLLCRPTWLIGLRVYLCLETASTVSLTIFHATAFTGCYLVRAIVRDSFATATGKFVNYSATYAQLYDCLSTMDSADGQVKLS